MDSVLLVGLSLATGWLSGWLSRIYVIQRRISHMRGVKYGQPVPGHPIQLYRGTMENLVYSGADPIAAKRLHREILNAGEDAILFKDGMRR
jgi:hypothetical protein